MQSDNPTAWEMPADRLVCKFADLCAKVGSACGAIDIMEGTYRSEAHYFAGVLTARLLGKDKELPFKRGDGVALKRKSVDSKRSSGRSTIRLQYEAPVENLFGFVTVRIIPSDEPLIVTRVYFKDGEFLLEFAWPQIRSDSPLLFPASEFLGARKVSTADAPAGVV